MRTFMVPPRPAELVRRLAAAAALASLGLITACGGGGSGSSASGKGAGSQDTGVASVTDPSAKPTQVLTQVERPLIRPDTSDEEADRLDQIYQGCLQQHGLHMDKNTEGSFRGSYTDTDSTKIAAAKKACASKQPETLPERDARQNPAWKDKYVKWINCMNAHGLDVVATYDTPGEFGFVKGLPPENKEKWVNVCESQAYVTK